MIPSEYPADLEAAYYERFSVMIPRYFSQGDKVSRQIVREARRAVAGDRGPLEDGEFKIYCPPGATL